MIQSRLERLLMSDDAFRAVVIRLIAATIALAVYNAPAANEQCQVEKWLQFHVCDALNSLKTLNFKKLFVKNIFGMFSFFFLVVVLVKMCKIVIWY